MYPNVICIESKHWLTTQNYSFHFCLSHLFKRFFFHERVSPWAKLFLFEKYFFLTKKKFFLFFYCTNYQTVSLKQQMKNFAFLQSELFFLTRHNPIRVTRLLNMEKRIPNFGNGFISFSRCIIIKIKDGIEIPEALSKLRPGNKVPF